jgi:predicted Zn-dependent protease
MTQLVLELVPLEPDAPPRDLIDGLGDLLQRQLPLAVRVGEPFQAGRAARKLDGQARSGHLVDSLITRSGDPPGGGNRWFLGITTADLAAPDRHFVFGEATIGGSWAVVSTARLAPPGTPPLLLLQRLHKEATHEIGHLAALDHCSVGSCVMSVSVSIDEIDRKEANFCIDCRAAFLLREQP